MLFRGKQKQKQTSPTGWYQNGTSKDMLKPSMVKGAGVGVRQYPANQNILKADAAEPMQDSSKS